MKRGTNSIWRSVLAVLVTASFAYGQQAGKDEKPMSNDPPVGTGWIDDIAFAKDLVGTRGIAAPEAKK